MKKNTLAILQARMSSKRLPGKVMLNLNGEPMVYWQIKRILKSKSVDRLIVAISQEQTDDVLANYLGKIEQEYFRGSLNNVLDRFIKVEKIYKPRAIVRLTGDCPLVMPDLIDLLVDMFYKKKVDYLSNIIALTFPDGLDIEVIKSGVLEKLTTLNLSNSEKEHVTLGIRNNKNLFSMSNYSNDKNLSHYRWTVDTIQDFEFVSKVFEHFKLNEENFTFEELKKFIDDNPKINQISNR
jgi:spore coat polysaccharide biosynthesis protein SpsF (cytidylyltransferase family)